MATIGFEEKLWQAADQLRNNMNPSEYQHVVLGLIFLKYVSDTFNERYVELLRQMIQSLLKIVMSIFLKGCFGFQNMHVGVIFQIILNSLKLVRLLIMHLIQLKKKMTHYVECFLKNYSRPEP